MPPPTKYDDDDLVSVAVGAQMIGVAPQTLRTYAKAGKVHTVRTPGNQRRFRVGDLRALLTPDAPADESSVAAS